MSKEQLSEKTFDATEPGKYSSGSLEISKTDALNQAIDQVDEISEAIQADAPIHQEAVDKLDQALSQVRVNFYGEEMTVQEVKDIPARKTNFEIYEKISTGRNFDDRDIRRLTFLPNQIAKRMIKRMIPNHHGNLNLDSLNSLSEASAKELVKHQGPLYFRGIKKMPVNTIRALIEGKNRVEIGLGLTSLSKEQAHAFVDFGGIISLPDLTKIDQETAKELGDFNGMALKIGLTDLPEDITRELARFIKVNSILGKFLNFHALTKISREAAAQFAGCKNGLDFTVMQSISVEAAKGFKEYSGQLSFDSFKKIDDKVAEALSESNAGLSFINLERISVQALQYFTNRPKKVYLTGLKQEDLTKEQLDIIQNSRNLVFDDRFGKHER